VILGVIAVVTGFASAAGSGGSAMVAFTFVAALVAGGDTSLAVGLAVTGAGVLAFDASGLAYGDSCLVLLGVPAVLVAGLVIGRNRGAYRVQAEQSAMLLAQRERLEAEQRRADLLDERARIAREIHDVLAHSIGALGIQIQTARAVLTDHQDIDRAGEILTAAQKMAAEGLVETRRAVHALRGGRRRRAGAAAGGRAPAGRDPPRPAHAGAGRHRRHPPADRRASRRRHCRAHYLRR
jgi:signal transduction histidine kinase